MFANSSTVTFLLSSLVRSYSIVPFVFIIFIEFIIIGQKDLQQHTPFSLLHYVILPNLGKCGVKVLESFLIHALHFSMLLMLNVAFVMLLPSHPNMGIFTLKCVSFGSFIHRSFV